MQTQRVFGCFNWRFMASVLGIAALIMAAAWASSLFARGSAPRMVLALIESALFGIVIVLTFRRLGDLDEMGRRIHQEALAAAFAATGILVTASGFLHTAGVPAPNWGIWIWPFMVVVWMGALMVVGRRYW